MAEDADACELLFVKFPDNREKFRGKSRPEPRWLRDKYR
jgi:hypothetical protein